MTAFLAAIAWSKWWTLNVTTLESVLIKTSNNKYFRKNLFETNQHSLIMPVTFSGSWSGNSEGVFMCLKELKNIY